MRQVFEWIFFSHLVKQMTAICFWFQVSCQYFKRSFYQNSTAEELYHELIVRMDFEHQAVDQRVDFDEYQKLVFDKEMKSLTEGEEANSKVMAKRLREIILEEKR